MDVGGCVGGGLRSGADAVVRSGEFMFRLALSGY